MGHDVLGHHGAGPLEVLKALGHLGEKLSRLGLFFSAAALQLILHLPQREQQGARRAHAQGGANGRRPGAAPPQGFALVGLRRLFGSAQARRHFERVARGAAPAGQLRQPAVMQGAAKVLTQAVVAFPLGFVKRLVSGGFMWKAGVLLRVGQEVHVQRVMQIGLDDQQRAFGPKAFARQAIGVQRACALAVADARQEHTPAGMVVGQVLGREHGQLIAGEAEERVSFAAAVKIDVRAKIDAGFAHQVLQVAKLIVGVATGIGQDDEIQLAFDQRVNRAVLKVATIGQVPPGPVLAKKSGGCLARQHQRFGQEAPRKLAQPAQLSPLARRAHPMAQAHAQKIHQQSQSA